MKKVYVITDMEGVAGINGWHECRPGPEGSAIDFERSRRLLTDEVAAAVLGARDGGAGDVLVLDGHRSGDNFIAERLPEGARYVMGRGRPKSARRPGQDVRRGDPPWLPLHGGHA